MSECVDGRTLLWTETKWNMRQCPVLIDEHVFKTKISPKVASGEDLNAATESVVVVFHINNGSILLSFRDVTTERTTDGRRTDRRWQVSHIWALRRTNKQF